MEANPGTAVELSAPAPAVLTQPDLSRVLWGDTWVDYVTGVNQTSVVEISGAANPNLPPSLLDGGVTGVASSRFLRESGYGISLGEVSAISKSRPRASRVYTNDDIRRLHGS